MIEDCLKNCFIGSIIARNILILVFITSSLPCIAQINKDGQVISERSLMPYNLKRIARLTGRTQNGETLPNPNQTDKKYDIGGTDLGIAWDMGGGKMGFFFGDTYGSDFFQVKEGGPGRAGNWRSNVLGIASDLDPSDGITFDTMVNKQIIYSSHVTDGTGSHTAIPTAAIHANGLDYVHYMDVRHWGSAGRWKTNYSGLYESRDAGRTWKQRKEIRFNGNSNFSQVGYARKDDYIYMAGTQSGRQGAIYLARFKEKQILDQAAYQYWSKTKGWLENDECNATPIIDDPAGELSITYNYHYKKWIIGYMSEKSHALVMRDATEITESWTEAKILVKSADYPGLYAPYILPVKQQADVLYFTMSMWWPYNVFIMKANLKVSN